MHQIICDVCHEFFHREPTAACFTLHSGNEWVLPDHCNSCHDIRVDRQYKDFDGDRNICNRCRDEALEEDDDLESYDHAAGEIDMIHLFKKKVRTLLLRSMSNARTLEGIEEGVCNLDDRVTNIESTLTEIQKGMSRIEQVLSSGDVNGNKVHHANKVGKHTLRLLIKQENKKESKNPQAEEGETATAASSTAGEGAEPGQGFKSETESTRGKQAEAK